MIVNIQKPIELIEPSQHQSQHNRGKTISEYHRYRIIQSNKTRWLPRLEEIGIYENKESLK